MYEANSITKDPICGMSVDVATALHAERDGVLSLYKFTIFSPSFKLWTYIRSRHREKSFYSSFKEAVWFRVIALAGLDANFFFNGTTCLSCDIFSLARSET